MGSNDDSNPSHLSLSSGSHLTFRERLEQSVCPCHGGGVKQIRHIQNVSTGRAVRTSSPPKHGSDPSLPLSRIGTFGHPLEKLQRRHGNWKIAATQLGNLRVEMGVPGNLTSHDYNLWENCVTMNGL